MEDTQKNALNCESCKNLRQDHLRIPKESLDAGIENGCKECCLLRDSITPFLPFDEVQQVSLLVDCALYLTIRKTDKQSRPIRIELFLEDGNPSPWKNIGFGRTINPDPKSDDSLKLIKRWLKDCRERHPSCKSASEPTLPTRVIDVGSSSQDARLYITKGERENYVALSHCWGKSAPLTTTKETLDSNLGGLHFDAQCQTFADAVEVTRLLGFKYLWIDSLCIIQDDNEDWTTEAARMSDVYRNAIVTLSADAAEDSSGGLFTSTSTRAAAHKTHAIKTTTQAGEAITIHARQRLTSPSNPHSAPHSSTEVHPSKLSKRGWVLQEKILSPRMIHFYREELVWSCHSQERCECRLMPGVSSSSTFRRLLNSKSPELNLHFEWPKLVQDFTRRDLTYTKDRLPAISGLATLMKQHTRSEYHAGMWSKDLAYSLLWMSDHAHARSPTRRVQVIPYAPTWSWASIDGPVKYFHRHLDQLSYRRSGEDEIEPAFRVLKATSRPSTSNPFGPTHMSFLTLQGQFMPISYNPVTKVWRPSFAPASAASGGAENQGSASNSSITVKIEPTFIYDVLHEDVTREDNRDIGFALLRGGTYIWGGMWSAQSTKVVAILLCLAVKRDGFEIYMRKGIVLNAFDSDEVWEGVPTRTVLLV